MQAVSRAPLNKLLEPLAMGKEFFRSWLDRKLQGRRWRLIKPMRVTREWKRAHGGRNSYARVTLYAEPAEVFSFSSTAAWPTQEHQTFYEPYVVDAIAYVLLGGATEALLGIRVVLENALVHDIDSNGNAYFQATKEALTVILRGEDEFADNRALVDE